MDLGLAPCSADTDGGGDNDGSERNNGRSPFLQSDDLDIEIHWSGSNPSYTVEWGDEYGSNAEIDRVLLALSIVDAVLRVGGPRPRAAPRFDERGERHRDLRSDLLLQGLELRSGRDAPPDDRHGVADVGSGRRRNPREGLRSRFRRRSDRLLLLEDRGE